MDREYTADKVPDRLTQRIQASNTAGNFRRRAVLTKGNTAWELVCCTVEAFLPGDSIPEPVPSRRYREAILYEDFLAREECLKFAQDLQEGHARFGDVDLHRGQIGQWSAELLPVANDYMARAGYVFGVPFGKNGGRASVRTLLAPNQPYYPDGEDATRDWLPLRVYHGYADSRNDHVLFLLPETRAFISAATFSDGGTLDITVSGTEVGTLPLLIKGAYWEGKELYHFEGSVENAEARLVVPENADRFECYLIDRDAAVYDFHREDRFSRANHNRSSPGSIKRTLEDQVRQACQSGEGLRIEFKPFIDPAQKLKSNGQRTKLLEVVVTVAAFSNTEGGHIYLGVDDDCTVSGVGDQLGAWAKGPLDQSNISRYLGALKSKIKDLIHGEVTLNVSHVEFDGMLVGIVEVSAATNGPVALQQEYHLYIRSGASNRKALPDQWKNMLKVDKPHGLF